jgi:hypothetical protein
MNAPLCKHLRTKKMFMPAEAEDVFAELAEPHAEPLFWCNCTQCSVGPDDKPAHTRICLPDRQCYEE